MGNPVVHFEVLGENGQGLQDFYKQAFDWQFDAAAQGVNVGDYRLVNPTGNGGIRGGVGTVPEGLTGFATFYIGVPNMEAAFGKIEKLGGKRMMGPHQVPGDDGPVIGYFRDPEDHVIGLVEIPS